MFHYNPNTGETGRCKAKTSEGCPFGVSRHFPTAEEAAKGYEHEQQDSLFARPVQKSQSLQEKADEQLQVLQKATRGSTKIDGLTLSRRKQYLAEVLNKLVTAKKTTKDTHARETTLGQSVYNADRLKKHEEIIEEIIQSSTNLRHEGKAILSGGLGGAGKSTVLRSYVDVESSEYITVNPDDIKEIMAKKGMIPKVKGLTPMEASPLAHEEASDISRVLLRRLVDQKANVIIDITIANKDKAQQRIDLLKTSGYESVRAVFVDIDPDTSINRAEFRYTEGMREYTTQGKGYGGRYLPPHLIQESRSENPNFRSKNSQNLVALARDGAFTSQPLVFDNNGESPKPVPYDEFSGEYTGVLPDIH